MTSSCLLCGGVHRVSACIGARGCCMQRLAVPNLPPACPACLPRLQLPAGTMVLVTNASRPDVPPHLARLLSLPTVAAASSTAAAADGVAYLAPSLAFNLGLALHLWPLLQHRGSEDSTSSGSIGSDGSLPRCGDRVLIRRYSQAAPSPPPLQQQPRQQQQPQLGWHRLAQPGSEEAAVPVAAEAHIAIVRVPVTTVLQQHAKPQQRPGSSASDDAEAMPPADSNGDGGTGGAGGPGGSDISAGPPATASPAATDDAVAALQQWFLEAGRVVSQGDVLAVPKLQQGRSGTASSSSSNLLLHQLLPNLHSFGQPQPAAAAAAAAAAPPELLYFKVVRLVLAPEQAACAAQEAAAAVDVGSTALKLVGSCSSGLPVGLQHYLATAAAAGIGGGSHGSNSSGSCSSMLGAHAGAAAAAQPLLPPAGRLLPAWRQLAELLASVLHPAAAEVPLRLAVLLHGPSGSGKSTAAAAAAAAAGCHLVSLSCHDVKAAAGAAERHTFEGLRTAFAAAADYLPAVLLLRQFSVLGDGTSHGGSGSSSAQSYAARLGSVLAECVRAHSSSSGSDRRVHGSTGAGQQSQARFPAPVVLVACAASADDLPAAVRRCFTHEVCLEAPDQQQRQQLLASSLAGVAAGPGMMEGEGTAAGAHNNSGLELEDSARHTAGLLPRELRAVAADAAAAAALHALPAAAVLASDLVEPAAAAAAEWPPALLLSPDHLAGAVDAARQRSATNIGAQASAMACIAAASAFCAVAGCCTAMDSRWLPLLPPWCPAAGAPKIPSVRWEDVGGLQDIKRAILDTGGRARGCGHAGRGGPLWKACCSCIHCCCTCACFCQRQSRVSHADYDATPALTMPCSGAAPEAPRAVCWRPAQAQRRAAVRPTRSGGSALHGLPARPM